MLALVLLAFSFNIVLAQVSPQQIISEVQKRYSQIIDFKAELTQSITSSLTNEPQTVKAVFYFKKVNQFRLELKNQILVSNGKITWNYTKPAKRVVISNYEENFFSPQNLLFNLPSKSTVKFDGTEKIDPSADGHEVQKLLMLPQGPDFTFKSLRIWVTKDFLIKKVEAEDWTQNKYTFVFNEIKINSDLNDQLFNFTVPSGVKTVDLR